AASVTSRHVIVPSKSRKTTAGENTALLYLSGGERRLLRPVPDSADHIVSDDGFAAAHRFEQRGPRRMEWPDAVKPGTQIDEGVSGGRGRRPDAPAVRGDDVRRAHPRRTRAGNRQRIADPAVHGPTRLAIRRHDPRRKHPS